MEDIAITSFERSSCHNGSVISFPGEFTWDFGFAFLEFDIFQQTRKVRENIYFSGKEGSHYSYRLLVGNQRLEPV